MVQSTTLAKLLPRLLLLPLAAVAAACAQTGSDDAAASAAAVVEAPASPQEETTCGLHWGESPTGYAGVDGAYARVGAVPPGAMKTMTLSSSQATTAIISEAASVRSFECAGGCPNESGRAQLVGVNAAINAMIMFSTNGFARPDADLRDVFNVLGTKRGADGTIEALCLYRLVGPGTTTETPFLMRRR
jgi:hypothetical protein